MEPTSFNNDYLNPLLSRLSKDKNKKIFLTGDFNFDLLKVSSNDETSNFFNILSSNLLLPLTTLPTKINTINDTLIDNIITNHYNPEFKTGNFTIGISDHLPSFMIVPKPNQNHYSKKHNLYKRDSKNFDRENFILDMLSINWDETLRINNNDVNVSFDNFINKINLIIDKYMPLKKVSNKEFKIKFKPWISYNIIDSITRKNKLFNKYIKCKSLTLKPLLYNDYKRLKNEILAKTRESKKEFYRDYFTKNNNKTLQAEELHVMFL